MQLFSEAQRNQGEFHMSDEEWILEECARALAAARPFVVDGRPNKDAERTLPIVDAALAVGASPGNGLAEHDRTEKHI